MYQKSPFPYLIVLVVIIGLSCFTNLTIDKEIEEPIIHVIEKNSTVKTLSTQEPKILQEASTQMAFVQ
jgi:hypothetical protein